jgi:NADPH2:quinone reductase
MITTSTTIPTTRTTTRAAVVDTFGGPEVLRVTEVPLASPTDTQVQVQLAAAAVNPVDLTTREGRNIPADSAQFPMVLGWDVAGTVVAAGSSATGFHVGDRVAAMVFQPVDQRGTYAEFVNLDAALVARIPGRLGLPQAATVPLAGLTASQLLDEVRVDRTRTLLVTGAFGAVGRNVVALAARAGLEVLGVARREQAGDLLALGATLAVERGAFTDTVRERCPDGVDAAIDLVGGATAHAAFDLVRSGGRYATSVPPYIDPTGRFETERDITLHVLTVHPDAGRLSDLLALASDGLLPTPVENIYSLDHAAEAHRRQAAGGLAGRVVIVP